MQQGKLMIRPASVMFQWWDFIPHYTLKDCWNKAPLELDISEVQAIYKRGPAYLYHCRRQDVNYLVYLGEVPEGLKNIPVQEVGPFEVVKVIRTFPSKWKKAFPKLLGLAFITIVLLKMFFSFRT
ncbi:hypothetical protein EZJ49_03765 [Bdellovibrio bacteriovorus]|uniref:hypothetical protein n=1 Tax=Bdellovibrio bacteriovorus TaxID=959 RepID=UPI0021D27E9A|nr:hypothetical protein [Bdellovibrio bacteriovorus]UXR65368.1 hypothetical protein EZJ49_03765 [Bdellovibrio bacteriovorus]